jgi:large subunit ribosomal protein L17
MRHRRAGVHLSRPTAHRKALFSNLVAALLTNERIQTTDAKAKETRRLAERTITWARRVGDILTKKADRRTPDESARVVHAVRMARRIVRDRVAVSKLFDDLAPRYLDRRGGYTRIVKIGQRPGDAAPMSLLELIPDDTVKSAPSGGKSDKGAAAAPAEGKAKAKKTAAPKAEGAAKAEGGGRKKAPAAKAEGAKAPAKKKAKKEE